MTPVVTQGHKWSFSCHHLEILNTSEQGAQCFHFALGPEIISPVLHILFKLFFYPERRIDLGLWGLLGWGVQCVLSHISLSPFSALTLLVLNQGGEWGRQQSPRDFLCPCLLGVVEEVKVTPLDSADEVVSVPSVPKAHSSSGVLGPCLALLQSTLIVALKETSEV